MRLTQRTIQQIIKDVNAFRPNRNSEIKSLNIVPGFNIKYPVLEEINWDGYTLVFNYIVLKTNATKLRVVEDVEVDEEYYCRDEYEITIKEFLNRFHKIIKEEAR
jgi:hypothetical protein